MHLQMLTRNSAIADKPGDAFRGHPGSQNMVPFHNVRYGLLLVRYSCSNLVRKTRRFQLFDFTECRDLEMQVKGNSRSLNIAPFDVLGMISYY